MTHSVRAPRRARGEPVEAHSSAAGALRVRLPETAADEGDTVLVTRLEPAE